MACQTMSDWPSKRNSLRAEENKPVAVPQAAIRATAVELPNEPAEETVRDRFSIGRGARGAGCPDKGVETLCNLYR